jgi:hypothetical protein
MTPSQLDHLRAIDAHLIVNNKRWGTHHLINESILAQWPLELLATAKV